MKISFELWGLTIKKEGKVVVNNKVCDAMIEAVISSSDSSLKIVTYKETLSIRYVKYGQVDLLKLGGITAWKSNYGINIKISDKLKIIIGNRSNMAMTYNGAEGKWHYMRWFEKRLKERYKKEEYSVEELERFAKSICRKGGKGNAEAIEKAREAMKEYTRKGKEIIKKMKKSYIKIGKKIYLATEKYMRTWICRVDTETGEVEYIDRTLKQKELMKIGKNLNYLEEMTYIHPWSGDETTILKELIKRIPKEEIRKNEKLMEKVLGLW